MDTKYISHLYFMNITLLLLIIQTIIGTPAFSLQHGDLLFQDSDCGEFCDAIEKVTEGYQGANLSHVGMVILSKDGPQIIEATTTGVVMTDLKTFLSRSYDSDGNSKVIVGRVNDNHTKLIPNAVNHAQSLLGKKYDHVFDIKNDTYYCSELVYEAFKYANGGEELFQLFPMTFIDPDTNETFGIWSNYYSELEKSIPEGQLGLNPGGISRSTEIEIVHMYGTPSGMWSK